MDKPATSEVVCCSQCPDGKCPDCPVAESARNNNWWKRIARKLGFSEDPKSETEKRRDDNHDKR
jgi:hypothetical protein